MSERLKKILTFFNQAPPSILEPEKPKGKNKVEISDENIKKTLSFFVVKHFMNIDKTDPDRVKLALDNFILEAKDMLARDEAGSHICYCDYITLGTLRVRMITKNNGIQYEFTIR